MYNNPTQYLFSSLSLNHQLHADDTQIFFSWLHDLDLSITRQTDARETMQFPRHYAMKNQYVLRQPLKVIEGHWWYYQFFYYLLNTRSENPNIPVLCCGVSDISLLSASVVIFTALPPMVHDNKLTLFLFSVDQIHYIITKYTIKAELIECNGKLFFSLFSINLTYLSLTERPSVHHAGLCVYTMSI